ncbi:MAG: hypothetical protein QOH39_1200 [Verrucomicrobiota bacterium]|jgi:hypothetical protein
MKRIQESRFTAQSGNTIIAALTVITILSFVAANVLMNCTTRYNTTSKQVKTWKEALYAAEAGGDVGFNEIRKKLNNPGMEFSSTNGWSSPAPSPAPTPASSPSPAPSPASWYNGSLQAFGESNSLSATVTVDQFTATPAPCYRVRSVGTARLSGLARVGMDDRMNPTTKGDSLLRKIDFRYDHFRAAYGNGDLIGASATPIATAQISRRVELIVVPIMPIEAAIKTSGGFTGPGAAGVVDSYDSKNGAYKGSNPASPYDTDAHDGDVVVGNSTFNSPGYIYGDVTTNGGHAATTDCSGVVDNNVAFTIPPQASPTPSGLPASTYYFPGSTTITPSPPPLVAPSPAAPVYKTITSFEDTNAPWYRYNAGAADLTINSLTIGGTARETYVNVLVVGDVTSSVTVGKGINARIWFTGNVSFKGKDFTNSNVDGSSSPDPNGNATSNPSRAGHVQFYGVSPASGTQNISLTSPGSVYAMFYAPGADISQNGNVDVYGAAVCKSYTGNGNTAFHFDKELGAFGKPLDYRVASYVEDVR